MKVVVDFDVCASTGSCMQVCPEVFEVRSDGYLYILQEEPGAELARQGARGRRPVPDGRDHPRGVRRSIITWSFHAQLDRSWTASGSMLCVGLDPDPARLPAPLAAGDERRRASSAGRSSTPPPTSCVRSSRRSPTSPARARSRRWSGCARTSAATYPDVTLVARRQARRHRFDGRALRPRGVRPLRRPRRDGQPVPRDRLGRAVLRPRRRA